VCAWDSVCALFAPFLCAGFVGEVWYATERDKSKEEEVNAPLRAGPRAEGMFLFISFT